MADIQTKTAGWVKIVLALSLIVNLLVFGLIGGIAWKGKEFRDRVPLGDGMAIVTRALPREYQGNVRAVIRDRTEEVTAGREALQTLRRKLATALVAEPFDMNVVEDIFDQQRNILSGLAGRGHEIVLDQISAMDPDDRAKYAENLLKPHTPHGSPHVR